MATTQLSKVVQDLRRAVLVGDEGSRTDGGLLESFIARGDEAAFAALVRRHGPMVLAVCRRTLGNVQDAEDAFQATFIVLARKAAAVVPREMVGNWLHGVAYRTALEARRVNARRRARERQVGTMPEPEAKPQERTRELQALLDQELSRLPDRFRAPIVLCDLEGRSRQEVARQLQIPEGTLSSRLATARKRLAVRLARRGLTPWAGASAAVPASLVSSTLKAATGPLSGEVAALVKGVMKAMFLTKLKIVTAVFLAVGLSGIGVGALSQGALADKPAVAAEQPQPQKAEKRDGDKGAPREKGDRPAGKRPAQQTVTLTGKVSEEVKKTKKDDGSEGKVTLHYLTEADGNKVQLPAPRRRENGQVVEGTDVSDFVGKEVVVSGRAVMVRKSESSAKTRAVRMTTITVIKLKK